MELSGPGVQFIVDNQLVRRQFNTTYIDYFLYIISATKLGEIERSSLNTASSNTSPYNQKPNIELVKELFKGVFRTNLDVLNYLRAALSKVKAILLEAYLIGAYFVGPSLARDRTSNTEFELDNRIQTKGQVNQGVNYTHNLRKGLPKGNIKGVEIPPIYLYYFFYMLLVASNSWQGGRVNLHTASTYAFPCLLNIVEFASKGFYILLSNKEFTLPQGSAGQRIIMSNCTIIKPSTAVIRYDQLRPLRCGG